MAGRSETGLDCHVEWGDVACMSSHKQYQIIDVFCNVHYNVNSYSNSKLNCPQVFLSQIRR